MGTEVLRVAIIGGGVAGLATAYELAQARAGGNSVTYDLFESSARFGGVIASEMVDGCLLERGPDSFLTEKPATAALCRELGLGDDLIGSQDDERKTYILVRNRLVPMPDGLMFLVPTKLMATALSPLFSLRTKLRMGLEATGFWHKPHANRADESVASLVARHYGQQAVDRLADPLLTGIFGGDSAQLSAQSVLPRLVAIEARYGSLTRGMLAGREKMQNVAKGVKARPIFTTLRGGLQQMIDALVSRLDLRCLHPGSAVQEIERVSDGWRLRVNESWRDYDAIVMATPAWAAGELLHAVEPALSAELAAIPYSCSILVNFIYDEAAIPELPAGFGFLVPAVEKRNVLAVTFVHRKFSGRAAEGKAVLRAFLGGVHHEELLDASDEELTALVREDLRGILGITAEPRSIEIQRWPRAMAQYAVGHKLRIGRIREHLGGLPGLHLVGNAYDGIGISDCIRLGREAARQIVAASIGSAVEIPTRRDDPAIIQLRR